MVIASRLIFRSVRSRHSHHCFILTLPAADARSVFIKTCRHAAAVIYDNIQPTVNFTMNLLALLVTMVWSNAMLVRVPWVHGINIL